MDAALIEECDNYALRPSALKWSFPLMQGDTRVKTVFLLRHAKSSWDEPHLEDFQRPLAPRGRKAAKRMGRYMAQEGLIPERALCSGARRAVETWERVMGALGEQVHTEFQEEIYRASPDVLLRKIRSLPDEEDSVLLVGHNPTFESLALRLAGSGKEEAVLEMSSKYPTGALAILDFGVRRWAELEEGDGNLRDFVRPSQLA